MALALLLAATLLLVSPAADAAPSASIQKIIDQLSGSCLQGAAASDVFQEIRSGQEEIRNKLTALQTQVTPAREECPDGWSRKDDSCYLIPPQKSTWYRAHHYCAALDRRARLASVEPASTAHIQSLVAATGDPWGAWIGLVKLESGVWSWSDGSPMVFTNWQPSNPSGDGVCGHIGNGEDYPGTWNDITCERVFFFVCQIALQ